MSDFRGFLKKTINKKIKEVEQKNGDCPFFY